MFKKITSITLVFFVFFSIFNLILPFTNVSASNMTDDTTVQRIMGKIPEIRNSFKNNIDIIQAKTAEEKATETKLTSIESMAVNVVASNLIENGDFELDPSSYGNWAAYDYTADGNAIFTWDDQTYHGISGHSLQIQGSNAEAYCINEVQISPGQEYDFSAWGKGLNIVPDGEGIGPYIYIGQYDVTGELIADTSQVFITDEATFDWSNASCGFVAAPNAASLFIILTLEGSGTVWYDDVFLSEVITPVIIPVTGITLNTSSSALSVGQQLQLTAAVSPDNATNRNVVWSIQSQSAADVITLSPNGLVTAVNPGTAVIRASGEEDSSRYAECSIIVNSPQYVQLPPNAVISDTVLDPSQTFLYAVDSQNSKLYAVNYETKSKTEFSFNLKPERIAYYNGKLYVTLLKKPHSSYTWDEQQAGAIAIINIDPSTGALTLNKQIDIATDPYDIAVSGDYIFISSGSGQWTKICSYSETSGQLKSSYSIRQQSFIDMNTSLNKLYTISTDTSPRDFTAYDLNDGIFTGSHDSPYHGDYSMAQNFRVSPDGKYVFNGSGLVLDCKADPALDLRFRFMLGSSFTDIAFDLNNKKIYTAVFGKTVYSYDYETFSGLGTLTSIGDISSLYYKNNELITLSKINGNQYIVETLDTSDATVIAPPDVNTIQLQKNGSKVLFNYSVTDSVMDQNNPVVYITDSTNKKVSAIDYSTGVAKELNTFYSPGSIALYNEELYVGFGAQGIIGIYDGQSLALKDNIYTGATFFDMTIGRDGNIYTSSSDYTRSYSRSSKQEISKLWVFEEGYLEVHPVLDSLYMTSMYVSPSDLYTMKFNNGILTEQYDSPYHGDYSIAYNNRISPDGKFIFNGSGEVFYCSQNKVTSLNGTYDNPNTDLAHAFSLNNGAYNDITFDLGNTRFYTGNSSGITAFNYSDFKPSNYIAANGEVIRLYNLPDQLLAIEKTGNAYFTEIIDKASFGAFTGTSSAANYSYMPIFTSQKAAGAQAVSLGTAITGSFQGSMDSSWYKLIAPSSGTTLLPIPRMPGA